MAEDTQSQQDVAKVYTATRRFPQLIGRTSDGTRIWGGPYTYTQIFGGGGALVVLWKSMGLWSTGGALMDWAIVLVLTGAVVFGLGKLPLGGRNPFSMLQGVGNAAMAGAPREVGGVAVRTSKPQAVYSPVRILTPLFSEETDTRGLPQKSSSPAASAEPAVVSASTARPRRPKVTAPDPIPKPRPEPRRPAPEPVADPLPPRLVALAGEGQGRRSEPRPRTAAAQTSVQSLLTMAQQRKEA